MLLENGCDVMLPVRARNVLIMYDQNVHEAVGGIPIPKGMGWPTGLRYRKSLWGNDVRFSFGRVGSDSSLLSLPFWFINRYNHAASAVSAVAISQGWVQFDPSK